MDLHKKGIKYYEKAIDLSRKGKNPFNQLRLASKTMLSDYQKRRVRRIKVISSTNGCVSCRKKNGKVYLISEALKMMPIPNKKCTRRIRPSHKYCFCRCTYIPKIELK